MFLKYPSSDRQLGKWFIDNNDGSTVCNCICNLFTNKSLINNKSHPLLNKPAYPVTDPVISSSYCFPKASVCDFVVIAMLLATAQMEFKASPNDI
jgi:hypothetical protein